jgi:hypothetical protein
LEQNLQNQFNPKFRKKIMPEKNPAVTLAVDEQYQARSELMHQTLHSLACTVFVRHA